MTYSWLAYLPPHLATALYAAPYRSPLDITLPGEAVALFADISGFTPMSEALGQLGPRGTEALSTILNRYFAAMIATIEQAGGSIGKFAGDALTVVFPTTPRTRRTTLLRALACALEMQGQMEGYAAIPTEAGTFRLAMKVGIGMGEVLTTTVGDEAIRLEYVIGGSAIDRCTMAEQQAGTGMVVVTDELLPLIGSVDALPLANGFHQVQRLHQRAHPTRRRAPDLALLSDARVAPYLHPIIAQRLAVGQQGLVDEHRVLTVLFVRFGGFDYHQLSVVPALQQYLADVVRIVDRYGGYVRQVDVGDKGSLYIVLFGAPIAHEDDADRALLCALDLRTAAPHPTATGIASGSVFCGVIGSAIRWEYAAIGDTVNLAARLMSAATWEEIVVDERTRGMVKELFSWQKLAPLTLKGKRAPVAAALLEGKQRRSETRLRAPGYTLPMVGRQAELTQLQLALEQTMNGVGQVWLLSGEAGMGKSRLVIELLRSATRQPITYSTGECLSYGVHSSYLVWQGLLRSLFGLDTSQSIEAQVVQVQGVIGQRAPHLRERVPLLSSVLNLPFDESDLTRPLDAKQRKELLEGLLVELLRVWAQQQPLLLILEDCHWMDALSREVLITIVLRCRDVPLMLLLSTRPVVTELSGPAEGSISLSRLPGVQELRLAEFTQNETTELISLKLRHVFGDDGAVPPLLVEQVGARAQGNPFYIDELLNLLHDRGVAIHDAAALAYVEVPDSLQRLIISRIDRLAEGPKTTLKVASILGRLFAASWLWQVYPWLGPAELVTEHLQVLQQLDFTQIERAEPELEYLFKHIITQEVAYESLALATRAQLHEQVGHFIEQHYGEELERWLDVLTYHYGHSHQVAKQREYYWRAGQAAKTVYANAAAIEYFTRLLPLLPHDERGEVLLALAEVQDLVGRRTEAMEHASAALACAQHLNDQRLMGLANRCMGGLLRGMGCYDEALLYQEQARVIFDAIGEQRELMTTLNEISSVTFYQGRYDVSYIASEATLQLALVLDDPVGRCQALNNLAIVHFDQGHYKEAIAYLEQGLRIAKEYNLVYHRTYLMGNLGISYFGLGCYEQAFVWQSERLALAVQMGFNTMITHGLGNLAAIYQETGYYTLAQRCNEAALASMPEPLNPRELGWLLGNLATVLDKQGATEQFEPLLLRAVALCQKFDVQYHLTVLLSRQAGYYLDRQQVDAAQAANTNALLLARERHLRDIQFDTEVRAVHIAVLAGRLSRDAAWVRLDDLQAAWTEPTHQALLNYTRWKIDPSPEHAQIAAAHYATLYATSPKQEYRERYQELTGEQLPASPPLPPLPAMLEDVRFDLPSLLQRVDALLAQEG